MKFHPPKRDELMGHLIYAVVGHELYGDSDVLARVFGKRIRLYRGGSLEMRYIPEIVDETLDTLVMIGPEYGYKSLREAKSVLVEEIQKYMAQRGEVERW